MLCCADAFCTVWCRHRGGIWDTKYLARRLPEVGGLVTPLRMQCAQRVLCVLCLLRRQLCSRVLQAAQHLVEVTEAGPCMHLGR